jgi:hypothetical protein
MLHLTMNCYYRSSRGETAPVLRDRLKIRAAGRSIAIEEAYRQAEFLRATYFELRDPSHSDDLVYSSIGDQGLGHAFRAPLPCAITPRAPLPGAAALPEPSPTFKTLKEFQKWFGAEMRAHKGKPYPLLEAALKSEAASR